MTKGERVASIKNVAETPWREFPNHFGGALSKPLVMPETLKSKHLDYRISMYQPMAYVARHSHKQQEQVYHIGLRCGRPSRRLIPMGSGSSGRGP